MIYPPGFPGVSLPDVSEGKASACNAGDLGLIPGSGRSLGGGNGNPFQHSCLEGPMDGGSWQGYSPGGCKESDMTEQLTLSETEGLLFERYLKISGFCYC